MPDTTEVGSTPVSTLIGDAVVRIAPDATLYDVADALAGGDIGVLAVGHDAVVGVVSERDLVRAVAGRRDLDATHAIDIAHTSLIWCDATATTAEVAAEMMEHWVRHVLVEEDGHLVGIVSARDLLAVYAAADVPID